MLIGVPAAGPVGLVVAADWVVAVVAPAATVDADCEAVVAVVVVFLLDPHAVIATTSAVADSKVIALLAFMFPWLPLDVGKLHDYIV
jgi:hypothetical protein